MPRPRSEKAHHKVLDAAVTLFAKRGIDATSMDAIAASSGVSKATIYKHWPDKQALAVEILVWLYQLDEQLPELAHKSLREDLISALQYRPAERRSKERDRILPYLAAYSARNLAFGKIWRAKVRKRQCELLERVLQAAMAAGELGPDLSVEAASAQLFGPLMYRQIFVAESRTDPPPPEFVAQIVDAFLLAFAKRPQNKAASLTVIPSRRAQ